MATPKIVVTTDVGTFSRKTARTYTHIVVVKGERFEVLEAYRLSVIKELQKTIKGYEADLVDGGAGRREKERNQSIRAGVTPGRAADIFDFYTAEWIQTHLTSSRVELAKLQAAGEVTEDRGTWFVFGWCGRKDLAVKLAGTADRFRCVRIYNVAGIEEGRAR